MLDVLSTKGIGLSRRAPLRRMLIPTLTSLTVVSSLLAPAATALQVPAARVAKGKCALTGEETRLTKTLRPSVAVRVSNTADARPQVGLSQADMLITTPVEGGTTRLIAIFHCSNATVAGPVRSARKQDAKIVEGFSKLLAFSGANLKVLSALGDDGVVLATEDTPGPDVFREPVGSTDVNSVRANITGLRSLAQAAGKGKPASSLQFGRLQSRTAAKSVSLNFGGATASYQYKRRAGLWARSQDGTPFVDENGKQIRVENVLVQEVKTSLSDQLKDAAGVPSPVFDLEGSGRAFLFRNGRVLVGTWRDRGAGAPLFRLPSGKVMKLAVGNTWLEMVPTATGGDVAGSIAFQ